MKLKIINNILIFLIIGFILLLLNGCNLSKLYTIEAPYAPIFTDLKTIYPAQIAFKLNTSLPIKLTEGAKSYNIYPFIIELKLYSSYQYCIDPYTSFILNIDNQMFFPKFPSELLKTIFKDLLVEKQEKLLILSPYINNIQLIYFLPFNIENKVLKLIFNINGKIYFLKL